MGRLKLCGVYWIVSPSGKIYVGSSVDMIKRRRAHFGALKRGDHHCKGLQHAFDKYDGKLQFIIIEYCSKSECVDREQWWIDHALSFMGGLYNSNKIARTTEQTFEVRSKISIATKGKEFSLETRQKISQSRKGMKFTPEHRAALSAAKIGKPGAKKGKHYGSMSVENRQKIAEKVKASWARRKSTDEKS